MTMLDRKIAALVKSYGIAAVLSSLWRREYAEQLAGSLFNELNSLVGREKKK